MGTDETTLGALIHACDDDRVVVIEPVENSGAATAHRDRHGWRALRRVAHGIGHAAQELLSRSPGTFVYLFVLAITVWLLSSLDAHTADVLLRSASTNVVEMSRSAPRVLVLSAFLVPNGNVLTLAVGFVLVHVPAERWLGTRRWLTVIVAGHVGASIITTVGILVLLRTGHEGRAMVYPIDVGTSYTLAAAAAALTFRLQRPVRLVWLVVLLGFFRVDQLVTAPTFTGVGHACALGIGLAVAAALAPSQGGVSLPLPDTRSPRAWWDYLRQPPPNRRFSGSRHAKWWPTIGLAAALAVGFGCVWLAHASGERTAHDLVAVPATVTAVEQSCASQCPRLHLAFTYDGVSQEITTATTPSSRVRVGDIRLVQFPIDQPEKASDVRDGDRIDPAGFLSLAATSAFGMGGLIGIVIVRRRLERRVTADVPD